jgi:hypothetical protein
MTPTPPGECPTIMPTTQVAKGMLGTGWTVVRGDEPRPFHVEVLGVMPDAIIPGLPMILVEVSDLPGNNFIEKAGGIWAGMSGSPVYDNASGRLIGAVAYGFSAAPSPIGGLTPASAMTRVLEITGAGARTISKGTIRLPNRLRREVARRIGRSVSPSAGLSRLPTPLVVSGLRARMRNRLERKLERLGASYVIVPGGRARRPTGTPASRPVPGGNFASLLSYGDVTSGGVGTTTYVCGNDALAFGHPMQFIGRAAYGANDADALAIVKDSSFGSFKMANIGTSFGTVDQDRIAALGVDLTETPDLIPVAATVEALDIGQTRTGRSQVTMSDFVPAIAPGHLFSNIDATIDRIGPGDALLQFAILGHHPDGTLWHLNRADRIASTGDISFESAIALDEILFELARNSFEDVAFDGVFMRASISDKFGALEIREIRVAINGGPFRSYDELVVQPGDELEVRVIMRRFRGPLEAARIPIRVPRSASGPGVLDVTGGNSLSSGCEFDPSSCPTDFDGLLKALRRAPRNDQVVASLILFGEGDTPTTRTARSQRQLVVSGAVQLPVLVVP